MRFILGVLAFISFLHPAVTHGKARSPAMQFSYQSLSQPAERLICSHQKEPNLPYDYTVVCPLRRRTTHYRVHLVVSYYPKSTYGFSAYEILYWVTDSTDPSLPVNHSSTTWIHQDAPNVRPTVFQLSQGVENDGAYLNLIIDNRVRPSR